MHDLFQRPKKSQFSGPAPYNYPRNVFALHQNHTGLRHVINRFINSYSWHPQNLVYDYTTLLCNLSMIDTSHVLNILLLENIGISWILEIFQL